MTEINSNDYHDYVFSDGKLIGEFEQMYKKSSTVPWYQNEDHKKPDYKLTLDIAGIAAPYDEIWELGCGLGYFCNALSFHLSSEGLIIGVDISSTAIEQAKMNFPNYKFECLDLFKRITVYPWISDRKNRNKRVKQLVAIRGCFWYFFPKIRRIVENIAYIVDKDNYFLISQNFPPLDTEFIGKEIISSPQHLMKHFEKYFLPLYVVYFEDMIRRGNDNWFIALFSRNDVPVEIV